MSSQHLALTLELNQKYPEAVKAYESIITKGEATIDCYINLAFIYWHSGEEFTWASHFNIPDEISSIGYYRSLELIDIALKLYPECAELYFWKKYFPWRTIGSDLLHEEVIEIINTYGQCNLIPYFFLILTYPDKYRDKEAELLTLFDSLPILKHLYIKPIMCSPA